MKVLFGNRGRHRSVESASGEVGRILRVEQVEHLGDRLARDCCQSDGSLCDTRRLNADWLAPRLQLIVSQVPISLTRAVPSSLKPSKANALSGMSLLRPSAFRSRPCVTATGSAERKRKIGATVDPPRSLARLPMMRDAVPRIGPAGRSELDVGVRIQMVLDVLDVELVGRVAGGRLRFGQRIPRRELQARRHPPAHAEVDAVIAALAIADVDGEVGRADRKVGKLSRARWHRRRDCGD